MQLPSAAPGFDEPLLMLRACHTRILKQCETLQRLAWHLQQGGPDDDARDAASNIYRYFSTAGIHHHMDEEEDLFPILLETSPELTQMIRALRQDHQEMERLWAQLAPLLADVDSIGDRQEFARTAAHFQAIYIAHIERENNDVLPAAQHQLLPGQLKRLGLNMARRRGVTL